MPLRGQGPTNAVDDSCAGQFWVDAVKLEATSSDGRGLDFLIEGSLASDIAKPNECRDSRLSVLVGKLQGSVVTELASVSSSEPAVCEPEQDPELISCFDGWCLHDARIVVPQSQVQAGRTAVRILIHAQDSSSAIPSAGVVRTGNCQTGGGPK